MTKKSTYNIAALSEARHENCLSNTVNENPHPQNIFFAGRFEQNNESIFQNCKKEQIVGFKLFMNYKNTIASGSKTRLKKSGTIRTEKTDRKESRQDLYSKQAVFDSLPKISSNMLIRPAKSQFQPVMLTQIDHNAAQKRVSKIRHIKHSSGLHKIKESMINHQNQWKKIFPAEKENTKFPSINKSILLFRSEVQKKEENELKNYLEMVKLRTSQWQLNLRSKTPVKQLIRSFHDQGKFMARGKSKLKLEKQWLEKKDQQGYKFKFLQ